MSYDFPSTATLFSNSFVQDGNIKHHCPFCNRQFHYKNMCEQHTVTCEFLFKSRRDKDRENDAYENLPNPQEMFKLVQHLALQVAKQQKEINHLKNATITKKRKVIMDWLLGPSAPKPILTFNEWVKTVLVSFDDLDKVFHGDLAEGMKHCLDTYFDKYQIAETRPNNGYLPICAFTQKPGTIYIYSSADPFNLKSTSSASSIGDNSTIKWRILDTYTFECWMFRLGHQFAKEFIKWQTLNTVRIHSSDEDKEQNIDYLSKVNGLKGKAYEDRRRSELRKWLFGKLARDFTQLLVEYDVV